MNNARMMKSFRSRENTHGVKTWARFYRYQLEDNAELDVSKVADKVYGSHDLSNKIRARSMILSLRKPLEKRTGRLLSCFKGVYSLIDPDKNTFTSAERLERNSRNLHTSHHFESYRRSVEISIKHNPAILNEARKQVHSLELVVNRAERNIFQKASQIVARHTAKLERRKS